MYLGFVELDGEIPIPTVTKNSSGVPTNADALPSYRVYGPTGLMPSSTGSLAVRDSGTVTGATNASPIVITSVGHGLTTGTRVTIAGVGGNTNANGNFTITVLSADTFSITNNGNSAYTSGGSWNVSGLYNVNFAAEAAKGFEKGQTYTVLVSAAVGGTAASDLHTFTVV